MQFVKCGSLKVSNFDNFIGNEDGSSDIKKKKRQEQEKHFRRRHGLLLPESIRCIMCGPSNCGKTNVMLTLLIHPKGLHFANIYLYSKSLFQPKYQLLAAIIKTIKGMGFFPFSCSENIVKFEDAKPNSIFIFDDIACDKQHDSIREFFSMGRHKFIDTFFISQTYMRCPKHLIRDNSNYLILFKQDDINLKHIYEEHVSTDMTFEYFKNFCNNCWGQGKYSFVVIDKDSNINNGRYRIGFDYFFSNNKKE